MENTKMDTYEKDFEKECRDYVKNIALELEDYADHEMIKCPQCEAVFNPDHVYHAEDNEDDEDDTPRAICPECETVIDLDYADHAEMWDYFDDCLDIEYHTDANKKYKSVRIMVTCGGPNVYVNTGSGYVELYWASTQTRYSLSRRVRDAIDECYEQMFDDLC